MRNLKKLLCLVLAVAMMASMFVIGASAAEKAYSETTKYPEAAAVITADAVKVMDGFEDGSMRYDAPVTREQAATIICKILLGTTAAENLKTGTAPFADVPANRWSAGYIAYLKSKGIVSGVTDTTFNPTAGVTGVQFAKMLLSAVGYGANDEFEGAAWDINTISQANASGLFTATKAADLTAGATREECMLYAFNTMTKIPTVKYNKTFESYYTGVSALDPVSGDVKPTETTANDPYAYTLAYTNFKLKQSAPAADGDADEYGRPSTSWVIGTTTIAENVASVAPIATLTGAVYTKELYAALGKSIMTKMETKRAAGKLDEIFELVVDGTEKNKPISSPFTPYVYDGSWAEIKAGQNTNQIAAAGATTELYVTYENDEPFVTAVVYYEHIDTVQRVNSTAKTLTLKSGKTVDSENVNISGYAKDDIVLITYGVDKNDDVVVTSIAKANGVVGAYEGTNAFGQKIYAGKGYGNSAVADPSVYAPAFDSSYTVYTDSFGNALMIVLYEGNEVANSNYAYITAGEAVEASSSVINGADAKVALTLVYPNGGKEVVYYAMKTSSKSDYDDADGYYITVNGYSIPLTGDNVRAITNGTAMTAVEKENNVNVSVPALRGWVTYTKNSAGEVTIKYIANTNAYATVAAGTSITTATGKATITGLTGKTANSRTVLNIIDTKGNVITYTGISKFPADTFSGDILYTVATAGSQTISVINLVKTTGTVASAGDIAYLVANLGGNANGTSYLFNVNGKAETHVIDDTLVAGGVYLLKESNGEYEAELVDVYSNTGANDDAGSVNGSPADAPMFTYGYGYYDGINGVYKYYESATIDIVDDNYFTTVEVTNDMVTNNESVLTSVTASKTYYYDANTVIVDLTGMTGPAVVDELTSGDVFVGYANEKASTTYGGAEYLSYIWIVA